MSYLPLQPLYFLIDMWKIEETLHIRRIKWDDWVHHAYLLQSILEKIHEFEFQRDNYY